MDSGMKISLVVPVFNESGTIADLLSTIDKQTLQPNEIILVDGGSTDNTADIIQRFCQSRPSLKLIRAGRAMPGKGRNIGALAAQYDWIAFTDAGIKLDRQWLESLSLAASRTPDAAIIYGNYGPQIRRFFDKCATISYVSPHQPGAIRGKSIVSCLLKKTVWEKAGGFPDWRAAEDLVFMENAEATGAIITTAPAAMALWQLQPDLQSTYRKFDLYSKYNVWAGRQRYWHYGVARQYLVLVPFIIAGIFHSAYWLLAIPAWLAARAAKRIWMHRHEFGSGSLFNPVLAALVAMILLVIDTATYTGWIKAITSRNPLENNPGLPKHI